jgi:hypothetical protein
MDYYRGRVHKYQRLLRKNVIWYRMISLEMEFESKLFFKYGSGCL